jgi:flavin reductase (DIM6/NTAB) family NADH-FMN oxidoreductase RutF
VPPSGPGTLDGMAQPGGSGAVGPFPPGVDTDDAREAYDKLRRRVLWKLPSGLYVLGTTDGADRRNGMTVNWVTQVSFVPKLVAVSVERTAFTHELLLVRGVFALNLSRQDDRAVVRKFTKPVEVDLVARTLNGFAFHHGVTGAPILDQAVAYVDCEVREQVEVGDHTMFVGEVVDAGFQADEDSTVLAMQDTRMNYGG